METREILGTVDNILANDYVWYHGRWLETSGLEKTEKGLKLDGTLLNENMFKWCAQMETYYYDDGYDSVYEALDSSGREFYAPDEWLMDNNFLYSEYEDRYLDYDIALESDTGEYATEEWYERNGYREVICDGYDNLVWTDDYICTYDTDVYFTREYAEDNLYWDGNDYREEEPDVCIYDYHAWDGGYEERSIGNEKLSRTGQKLFMGTELEVDDLSEEREDFASSMLDYLGRELFHAERDGSVDHEYISQPMTLEKRQSIEDAEREALQYARHYARSHDAGTCGLHVHVNESFFDDHSYLRLKTILEFFKEELFRFSRRQCFDGGYYSFERSGYGQSDKNNLDIKTLKDECVQGHSGWYNEHSGRTFEFRLFRGTLKYDTLMASLEIVSNICWLADSDKEDITWNDLVGEGDYCKDYSESRGISNEDDVLHLGLLEKKYHDELEEERRREELHRLRMSLCSTVNNVLNECIMRKDGHNYYFNKQGDGLIMFKLDDTDGIVGEAVRRLEDDESFDIFERTYGDWDYVMSREKYIEKWCNQAYAENK
jgi:hypothetical protein